MENQPMQPISTTNKRNPFKIATIILSVAVLGLGGLAIFQFINNSKKDNSASNSQNSSTDTDAADNIDVGTSNNSNSQINTSTWATATFGSGMTDKYLQFINADFKQFSVSVKYPTDWTFRDEEWDIDSNGKVVPPSDSTSVGVYNKNRHPMIFLRGLSLPSSGIWRDSTCGEEDEYATIIKLGDTSTDGYWIASEVVSYNFEPVSTDNDNTGIYIWITNADKSILNQNGIATKTRCSLNQSGVLSAYPNGETTATYLRAFDVLNNTNNYRNVLEIFKSATITIK